MRTALAVAAALAAAPATALPVDRLESLVGNRVAGPAVACIESAEVDSVHLVHGGLVYVMRSPATVFVNRPPRGATFLHDGVTPAIMVNGALLCSAQQLRLLDENSRQPVATITLGEFIPYRRSVTP